MVSVVYQWVDTEDADTHTTVLKVAFPLTVTPNTFKNYLAQDVSSPDTENSA